MPKADSIFPNLVSVRCGLWVLSSRFPDTAATGETREARFAGDLEASRTVSRPNTMPLTIPTRLTPNTGQSENSPCTQYRKIAPSTQETATPRAAPMGMAVLHQFRASNFTNRMTCRLLMPIQRIIPKNCVRWATVLLRLPEIIRIPAARISRNRTPAKG